MDKREGPPVPVTGGIREPDQEVGTHGGGPHADPRVPRLLRALLALPRTLRLYPTGHARVETALGELATQVAAIVADVEAPLRFVVDGPRLELNGATFELAPELAACFAYKLAQREVHGIHIEPGIGKADLRLLAELLSTDHSELLRTGGADAFLQRTVHRDLALIHAPGEGPAPAPGLAACLGDTLGSPDTIERFDRLRWRITEGQGHTAKDREASRVAFDRLLWGFLEREEWAGIRTREAKLAVEAFLDIAENALNEYRSATALHARIGSLDSFFAGRSPAELALGGLVADAGTEGSYTPAQLDTMLAQAREDVEGATTAVKHHLEFHPYEENALLILCELLVSARDLQQYYERRQMFFSATSAGRFSSPSVARILRFIAVDMRAPMFESRDNLLHSVFDATRDEEALKLFLVSMTDRPDVVRPILRRFAHRAEPFPLLVKLLGAPVLAPFRKILSDVLVDAARARRGALERWARGNRAVFLKPEIFEPLFARGTEMIGAICKEVLMEGPARDRSLLIDRLKQTGSETALRVLILGMSFGNAPCDPELLEAIASFRHPLASSALREVVHRSNTAAFRPAEARTALVSLAHTAEEDDANFLWDIVRGRSGFLPRFHRGLRRLTREVLHGQGLAG